MISTSSPVPTPTTVGTPTPAQTSALSEPHEPVERDVTYCAMDNVPLLADIYFSQAAAGPAPLVIFIHGGSWTGGSKSGGMGFDGITALTSLGYTIASIDYRLASDFKMPAMIQDVKCAVRSFRAHAAAYGIDSDRIGVIGASAGGHLVSMLGTTDESAGFDVGEYLGYSSRVRAVVNMAGPTDLRSPFSDNPFQVAESVFGTIDPGDPIFVAASPITWISPDDPPFLIIHGEDDQVVPFSQSSQFYESLVAQGVEARLVVIKNAGHGTDYPNQSPSREELLGMIIEFFEDHLK